MTLVIKRLGRDKGRGNREDSDIKECAWKRKSGGGCREKRREEEGRD